MAILTPMSFGISRRAVCTRPLPLRTTPRPAQGLGKARLLMPQRRRAPAPANALALPPSDWTGQKTLLQHLLALLFAPRQPARPGTEDEIPPEYRSDAHGGGSHSSAWVHSHIATRLATAGDDELAD